MVLIYYYYYYIYYIMLYFYLPTHFGVLHRKPVMVTSKLETDEDTKIFCGHINKINLTKKNTKILISLYMLLGRRL